MFRLVLLVATLSASAAYAQDTDTDTAVDTDTDVGMVGGDHAALLAGEEGGSSCATVGQVGLGLTALASILAAARARSR